MTTLIEQIKHGKIWNFHGGIHPPENKQQSNKHSILPVEIPSTIILPIKQHFGSSVQILVSVGDHVLKGQPLTKSNIFQCCPVHAPTSGDVIAIEAHTIIDASELSNTSIIIRPDFDDQWTKKQPIWEFLTVEAETLITHVHMMGISGLGGAGFPSAIKLQSGLVRTDILIINGAECEPYVTADDLLMQEHSDEIIQGIEILQHIVQPQLALIAIEDNKPKAISALKRSIGDKPNILVQVVPTKYPSGGEKQLVKLITGKEVPTKSIPTSIGVLMQNVGTVFAVKRAIIDGEPLIQRVVTLTGATLQQQRNRWTLLGTPIRFLLDKHGYTPDNKIEHLIIGGPMMGVTIPHANVPISKETNCVLVPSRLDVISSQGEMSCIRCSDCADVCPAFLLPQQLNWYAKDHNLDKCEEYNLFDCIECGACAYVCPSEIPLVRYYRQAKSEIRKRNTEKLRAELARKRFEAKRLRTERKNEQRSTRDKQSIKNRHRAMEDFNDSGTVTSTTFRLQSESKQSSSKMSMKPVIAAAIAKAKAKQIASNQVVQNSRKIKPIYEEHEKQDRACKVRDDGERYNYVSLETSSDKNRVVAAAIARAKARKKIQLRKNDEDK
ncbi:electron transport complex subunit RsxC [Candidatus Enterovibrio escicola]|uniref:Ion-translocating oxidoreductase complex subunit C n=3 Tax=Candidatus Enterovibrio escicola TaxID=1927127 RepID=A0A2A5T367_9GAMM|nr:electron transport complex subunit RsxC [Candidatus Enterovibrio escacola]PCS22558.1 Electron transport complex protein RnfC [Candidatus Enterovibrio escacola]